MANAAFCSATDAFCGRPEKPSACHVEGRNWYRPPAPLDGLTADGFPPLSAWITQLWKPPEPLYDACAGAGAAGAQVTAGAALAPGAWLTAGAALTGAGAGGAGGLYQFLPATWHALGFSGLPQNASVAEQNAAFAKEYAQSGGSAWSPSDGC